MKLPESVAERARMLGGLVSRVQSLADGVGRRSGSIGRLTLLAAPLAWITLFGRWAFDSAGKFVFFTIVLGALVAPVWSSSCSATLRLLRQPFGC